VGSVVQFAAVTGVARVLYTEPELVSPLGTAPNSACNEPMWVSDTGSTVLLACYQQRPPAHGHQGVTTMYAQVLHNGRVTRQLPWLARLVLGEETAFPGIVGGGQLIPATPQYPEPPVLHVRIGR
jgi:hypothetical protein